tara:strand:- start:155 stop:352 length:198 start_codon:yes stop_codon:yes gene_type:complete
MSKKRKKLKSPIDTMIVDLIMEHYNVQMLQGKKESLSGEEFMELVLLAEQQYYENQLTDIKIGMA